MPTKFVTNPRRPAAKKNSSSKPKVHRAGEYAVIEDRDGLLFFGRYERNGEFVLSRADKSRMIATEAGRKKAIATYFARVGAKTNPRPTKRTATRTTAQNNAARAMRLFHSGKASSLADAWAMIRKGR